MPNIAGSDAAIASTVRLISENGAAVEMCGVRIENLAEYNFREFEERHQREFQERVRENTQKYITSLEDRIDELERENAEMKAFGLDSEWV